MLTRSPGGPAGPSPPELPWGKQDGLTVTSPDHRSHARACGLPQRGARGADPRPPASTHTPDAEPPPAARRRDARTAASAPTRPARGPGEDGTLDQGPRGTWPRLPPRRSPSPGTVGSGSRARAVRPELIVAGSVAASGRARSGPQPPGRSGSLAGGHCGVAPWTRPGAGVAPGKAVSTPTVGRAGVSTPQWRESAGTGPGPRPWREGLPLGFRKALSAARKALFETSTEAPRCPHGARVCAAGPGLLMRGPARGGTLLPLLWGARGLTRPKAAGGGGPFSAPHKASCCC